MSTLYFFGGNPINSLVLRINHATAQRDVLVCLTVACNSDLTFDPRLHSHRPRDPSAITDRNGEKKSVILNQLTTG